MREPKEADIVKVVLEGLAAMHVFAIRLNTAGFKVDKRFFRSHNLGAGAADILALADPADDGDETNRRWFVPTWIECKTTHGRQSPEQKNFQSYVEALGHRYLVVRSWEDLCAELER